MNEYDYLIQELENSASIPTLDTSNTTTDKYNSIGIQDKVAKLDVAKSNKEQALRKDTVDYGDDNWLIESAKSFANEFLPHEYQIPVNKEGKRYNTANKDFNEDDLSNIWNKYQDDPEGDKALYYLRKMDPHTGQYVYKPGIAHVSAADRYKTQSKAQGWELIGEKRFHEASAVEKRIHGNKAFLEDRVFDYGTTGKDGADNFFGAGKSELYNRDILGLDTGTSEQYEANMDQSIRKMVGLIDNERQAENTFEFIDAFQAGGVNLAGGALKLIGEAVSSSEGDGAIEALGKRLQKDANKIAGYNAKTATVAMAKLEQSFNEGDVLGYLGNMLKGSPQWLAQSLPNMAGFAATSVATTAVTKNPVAGLAAGSALMGAVRANDTLDKREEATGRKATAAEIRNIYGVSTALSLLEYGALKYAFTGKGIIAKDAAGNTSNLTKDLLGTANQRKSMAMMLGSASANIGKGALAEGSEEVIAGLTEYMMENYGTEKYNGVTIAEMLTSDEARTVAIQSFGAGAGAGGLAGTTASGFKAVDAKVKKQRADKLAETVKTEAKSGLQQAGEIKDVYTPEDVQDITDTISDLNTQLSETEDTAEQDTLRAEVTYQEELLKVAKENLETLDEGKDVEADIEQQIKVKEAELQKDMSVEDRAKIETEIGALETQLDDAVTADKEYQASIEASLKELEDSGATKEEVDAVRQHILKAKFTNEINKEIKEAKLQIEVDHDMGRPTESGGKKPKSFEVGRVDNEDLVNIAEGALDAEGVSKIPGATTNTKVTESLPKKLASGSLTQESIAAVYESIKGKGKEALASISEDTSDGRALRTAAILGDVVNDAVSSEYHVTENENQDGSKVDYARVDSVATELGKRMFNSFGMKLSGDAKSINKEYARIGMKVLEFGKEAGLITIESKAVVPTRMVDAKGRPIYNKEDFVEAKVIRLTDSDSSGLNYSSEIGNSMKALSQLMKSTNELVPSAEASTEVEYDSNTKPDKEHLNLIKRLQELKFKVKPSGMKLLQELRAEADKYTDLDNFFKKSRLAKEFLGTKSSKSFLTKSSDQGRTINRQDNLRKILDAMATLPNEFHYSYESAINERIHVMETILEFQGDKYMARQLITGGEYTTKNSVAAQILIESIAEELSIPEIDTKGKKSLDVLLEKIEFIKNPTPDSAWGKLISYMESKDGQLTAEEYTYEAKKLGIKSPFKAMNLINAVYDVATASDKNKITTDYMAESDMSASGVMNTLLNLSGIPAIQKALSRIINEDMDPYQYLNVVMKETGGKIYDESVAPILEKIDTLGIDSRDVAKYPIMKWFYGSHNVATDMAKDLSIDIITKDTKESTAYINEILGTEFKKDVAQHITKDQFNKLAEYFYENLGVQYEQSLEKAFPGVVEYRTQMGDLFTILKNDTDWDGKIATAMMATRGITNRENRMSVKKDKQTPLDVDGVMIPMNMKFDNKNSFFVNLQHATDAFQLMRPLMKLFEANPEYSEGIMTVHDATYANANVLEFIQKEFEPGLKEAAIEYDYLNAAIEEALFNLNSIEQTTSIKKKVALIEEMKAVNDKHREAKAEYLDTIETNFFGSKTIGLQQTTPVTKKAKKPKKATEQKKEAKSDINEVFNKYLSAGKITDIGWKSFGTFTSVKIMKAEIVGDTIELRAQKQIDGKAVGVLYDLTVNAEGDILTINGYSPKPDDRSTIFVGKERAELRPSADKLINKLRIAISTPSKFKHVIRSLIQQIPVAESHQALKDKLISGLDNGIDIKKAVEEDGKWHAGHMTIYADTVSTIDERTGKEMTPETLIETLAHEMDHAINYEYIQGNLKSTEVQYILKAIADLVPALRNNTITDKNIRERIQYIVNPVAGREGTFTTEQIKALQVTEFMSIMRNEPEVAEYLAGKHMPVSKMAKLSKLIEKILEKVQKWLSSKSDKEIDEVLSRDGKVKYFHTVAAMEALDNRAKIYNATKKENTKDEGPIPFMSQKQIDVYKDAYINPGKYAEGIIARQNSWLSSIMDIAGGYALTLASPLAEAGHKKLAKHSRLYASTTSKLRHGFYHSDIAQRTRTFLGSSKDVNEKFMNDMLQLGDDIQQESAEILTTMLPDLDRRINNLYTDPKDRVKVYKLFAKTAIADLQYDSQLVKDLLDGNLDVDEAIKTVMPLVNKEDLPVIKNTAIYFVTGKMTDGITNLGQAGIYSNEAKMLTALLALKKVNATELLNSMPKPLKKELYSMAVQNKALVEEINNDNYKYDGNYSKDIHDNSYEYRLVNKNDMRRDKYSTDAEWKVIREPEDGVEGIVARKLVGASNVPGVGLSLNMYENGFFLSSEDTDKLKTKLDKMKTEEARDKYLKDNSITTTSTGGFRIVLDENTKVKDLDMMQSAAHSMYRTYVHSSELLAMQAVRDIAVESATDTIGNEAAMDKLNDKIAELKGKKDIGAKDTLPMFLHVDYDYESYESLPVWVQRYYKVAENVSSYKGLNQKITLVKRGYADIALGHPNFSPFSGDTKASRTLARAFEGWKYIVVMAKQKMVITNPKKLGMDFIANVGILGAKDVSIFEMKDGFSDGWKYYREFSKLRSEKVILKIKVQAGEEKAKKQLEALERKIEKHPFYDAFKAGFVQSYSTSLVVKEFDTVSGLQKSIDDIVEGITKDNKGNANEIFKAIKWWQGFGAEKGLTVDALVKASAKLAGDNDTSVGHEMIQMADRLRKAREDKDSVSKYIGNIIGSPNSEAIAIGGAVMVTADVLSKYTLAQSLMKRTNPETGKKYTKEEAYVEANNTFIDYRKNMPAEIKALSDSGVLMFPSFWLKAQKVIAGLVHYHPATALGGYAVAEMLDISNASFLDVNVINKALEGTIVNEPTSLVDWDIISPYF